MLLKFCKHNESSTNGGSTNFALLMSLLLGNALRNWIHTSSASFVSLHYYIYPSKRNSHFYGPVYLHTYVNAVSEYGNAEYYIVIVISVNC